jgi:hypothetical protein
LEIEEQANGKKVYSLRGSIKRERERDDGELTRMRIQPKGTERITVALMGIRKRK